jgi:hypothetical protein
MRNSDQVPSKTENFYINIMFDDVSGTYIILIFSCLITNLSVTVVGLWKCF